MNQQLCATFQSEFDHGNPYQNNSPNVTTRQQSQHVDQCVTSSVLLVMCLMRTDVLHADVVSTMTYQ